MKIAMIRVGVDASATSGGIQGPLFKDGSFEFIPIPENPAVTVKYTYGDLAGRHGQHLGHYFPKSRKSAMEAHGVHNDPEWETYTYGDWSRPKSSLKHLEKGDILMFTCGLQGWDFCSDPGIYLAGYFVIEVAILVTKSFSQRKLLSIFGQNDHVRNYTVAELVEIYDGKLVLVKGSFQNRLLKKAVLLSTTSQDSKGRTLKVLSPKMQCIFGDFGGKISIQRSPTRWIDPAHTKQVADYLQSLD